MTQSITRATDLLFIYLFYLNHLLFSIHLEHLNNLRSNLIDPFSGSCEGRSWSWLLWRASNYSTNVESTRQDAIKRDGCDEHDWSTGITPYVDVAGHHLIEWCTLRGWIGGFICPSCIPLYIYIYVQIIIPHPRQQKKARRPRTTADGAGLKSLTCPYRSIDSAFPASVMCLLSSGFIKCT